MRKYLVLSLTGGRNHEVYCMQTARDMSPKQKLRVRCEETGAEFDVDIELTDDASDIFPKGDGMRFNCIALLDHSEPMRLAALVFSSEETEEPMPIYLEVDDASEIHPQYHVECT